MGRHTCQGAGTHMMVNSISLLVLIPSALLAWHQPALSQCLTEVFLELVSRHPPHAGRKRLQLLVAGSSRLSAIMRASTFESRLCHWSAGKPSSLSWMPSATCRR